MYGGSISHHYSNDFRIGYFDNKILCIEEYIDWDGGGVHGDTDYNYTIILLETGKKLNNDFDLYTDLVDYSEEFTEFFKKEFIKYHEISEYNFEANYLPLPPNVYDYYSPTIFIFNNDGTYRYI